MSAARALVILAVVVGVVYLIVGTPLIRDLAADLADWIMPGPSPRADEGVPVPFTLRATDTVGPYWACVGPGDLLEVTITGDIPVRLFNLDIGDAVVSDGGATLSWSADDQLYVPQNRASTVEWVYTPGGWGGTWAGTRTSGLPFVMPFSGDYC